MRKGYPEVNMICTTVKERESVNRPHKEWYDRIKELSKRWIQMKEVQEFVPDKHNKEITEVYDMVKIAIPVFIRFKAQI